jgi:hypothetical protein
MLFCKNAFSLTAVILSFLMTSLNAFQDEQINHHEYLEIYDLCIAFEQAYNNLTFHGSVHFNDTGSWSNAVSAEQVHQAVYLIKKIKTFKEHKQVLLSCSPQELQEIKTELIAALQAVELLKKDAFDKQAILSVSRSKSVYKEWVKVILKLIINQCALGYFSQDNPVRIPLAIIQIYYLFSFGKHTLTVLNDLAEKALQKIW